MSANFTKGSVDSISDFVQELYVNNIKPNTKSNKTRKSNDYNDTFHLHNQFQRVVCILK